MDRQPLTDRLGDRLLAEYGGAAAAYSLRALNGNGDNVVRVRRASDNDEKDFTALQISSGEMVNWVNSQIVPPLDIGIETSEGRIPVPEGGTSIGTPAAAYSLRNLSTTYTGNVVDVRRNDGTEESFTAAEVSDGTLEAWVLAPVSSLVGNRMYFDGVNDNVTTTANAALSAASGDFFIEFNFLVPASNPAATQFLIEKGGQSNTVYDYSLRIDTSGRIFGGIQKTATGAFSNAPLYTSLVADFGGEVVTVKLALESGTEKIYINGVRKDDTTISPGGNPATSDLSIGSTFAGGSYYAGLIYSVNINDQVAYQGYGNTNADWLDTVGSNNGTVNGTPALFTGQGINGTVSKWYDQSGNDNHAVQTTPANQPKIVEGGSLIADGIDFDGIDDTFSVDIGSAPSIFTISSVIQLNTFTVSGRIFQFGTGNVTNMTKSVDNGSTFQVDLFINTSGTNGRYRWQVPSGEVGVLTLVADFTTFTNTKLYWNGAELTRTISTVPTGTWNVPTGNFLNIASPSVFTDPNLGEMIFYSSDQSDNRTAIEANIGETYGITGIPAYDNTVDGFVETWYDQSGNGNDATQSVTGNQPKIVDGGALLVDSNGNPVVKRVSGQDRDLEITDLAAATLHIFTAYETSVNGSYIIGGGSNRFSAGRRSTGTYFLRGNSTILDGGTHSNNQVIANFLANGASSHIRANGSLVVSGTTDTPSTFNRLFTIVDAVTSGELEASEIIVYQFDQSANQAAIEANQAAAFGITLP